MKQNNKWLLHSSQGEKAIEYYSYPIFPNSKIPEKKSDKEKTHIVYESICDTENVSVEIKEFLKNEPIKQLEHEHILEVFGFIHKYYDPQIDYKAWINECITEFNSKDIKPLNIDYSALEHIVGYNKHLLSVQMKNPSEWFKTAQNIFYKNYKLLKYPKPKNLDSIIHNIVATMLQLYPIEERYLIHSTYCTHGIDIADLCTNIASKIMANLNSVIIDRAKAPQKYKARALFAIYYCCLSVKDTLNLEYLSKAMMYMHIAGIDYVWFKEHIEKRLLEDLCRANKRANDYKFYEWIQFKVGKYLSKNKMLKEFNFLHVKTQKNLLDEITKQIFFKEQYFEVAYICGTQCGNSHGTLKDYFKSLNSIIDAKNRDKLTYIKEIATQKIITNTPYNTLRNIVKFYLELFSELGNSMMIYESQSDNLQSIKTQLKQRL